MQTEEHKEVVTDKSVIVRQYGLLAPMNWGDDCFEHLYLQTKLWNRLVEIERENRAKYRAIVGTDEAVAEIDVRINEVKSRLSDMDIQRKELRKDKRSKHGVHTEPLDEAIKASKSELKELSAQAKEIRTAAKERIKAESTALKDNDDHRKELVKAARNASGLWWGNYNAVCNSYDTARSKAMKEGAELKFHRFNGSGRFTCQIQGGLPTEDLLAGKHSIAQIRLIDGTTFTEAAHKRPPALMLQEVGSRRDSRQYGILSITVYTFKDDQGGHRRTLDFPIILHRPLPENATLKQLVVNRKKVGTDYRWSVTFTFTGEAEPVNNPSPLSCGINLGWKQVKGGLRIATVQDGHGEPRHIVLPQHIVDRLDYVDGDLKSRIDTATNENFAWILDKWKGDDLPEPLAEVRTGLRRAKKPHPAKFAKAVFVWREQCPEYMSDAYQEAEKRRKAVKRLSLEHSHLRDKVLRCRQDFYRVEAKKLAEKYSRIVLDKMDLRKMAALEKSDGTPNELNDKARRLRTIAAVSEFREWLIKQAQKTGTAIDQILIESTHTCSACGGVMEPSEGLFWMCRSCGVLVDQDDNAATNLLQQTA
jgi:hypothetical protein